MAFKLKHQKESPLHQRFVSSGGNSDEVDAMNQMIAERAAARGITPRDHSNETITSVEGKKGLSGMLEGGKDFIQDLKTFAANPFDAARAVIRTDNSGGNFPTNLKDLKALNDLAAKDDGSVNSEQAKTVLSPSAGFNFASSMVGPALTAQTFLDLASGDPTSAVLGKAKKLKPVAKALKKSKIGQVVKEKVLPSAYIGFKTQKHGKKI